jgi:hypothetical protein
MHPPETEGKGLWGGLEVEGAFWIVFDSLGICAWAVGSCGFEEDVDVDVVVAAGAGGGGSGAVASDGPSLVDILSEICWSIACESIR